MSVCRLVVVVALVVAAVVAAGAQSPAGQGFDSRLQSRTLANGLTVIVVEKHGASVFSATTMCLAGFAFDPPGGSGTAHLTEHLLAPYAIGSVATPPELYRALGAAYLKEGDGQADRIKAIENEIARTKGRGDWAVTTIADTVQYGVVDEPSEWLERFVQAAASTLKTLPAEDMESQKGVVIRQLNEAYGVAGPSRVSMTNLATAFPGRPYANPGQGRVAEVRALKFESLLAFHTTYYSPDRCAVVAVGDVQPAEVFQTVAKRVGDVPRQPAPAPIPRSVPPPGERRATVESTTPARLVVSFVKPALPARDDAVAQVVIALLTGGDRARLVRTLVAAKAIAASVDGGSGGNAALLYDNLMTVAVYPAKEHTPEEMEAETLRQLEILKAEPVTADELRDAIARVQVEPEQIYKTDIDLAAAIARTQLTTGDWKNLMKPKDLCPTVTAEDIMAFARKYLTAENRTVLAVVPPKSGTR